MKSFKLSKATSSEISAAKKRTRFLSSNCSSIKVSSSDGEFRTTEAPREYSLCAVASPIACVDPVTNTILSIMVIQIMPQDRSSVHTNSSKTSQHNERYVSKGANGVEFIDWGDESRKIRKIISEDMINRGRWFYHLQINTLQISWQGLQDYHQTYCGLISFPDEEGRDNA
jgi:hypothetical protein